jgi:probable addiction module antidote protein
MARETIPWDAADSLETREDIAAYLDAVLEDGDPDLLKAALGDIARAKRLTEIAHAAGLRRANLSL